MTATLRRFRHPRSPKPAPDDLSLVGHLTELRRRLLISVASIGLGAIVAFIAYKPILNFLLDPYCGIASKQGRPCTLYISDPLEGFSTRLKVAGTGGLLLALPVVLWQIWGFVTPGLHSKERRLAVPFVAASLALFSLGGVLAYVTFPRALTFLIEVGGPDIEAIFSPAKYLRLVIFMVLAFGLAFEFPVLLVFLQMAGILTSARLRGWRRPAVVVIFVAAAVITPSQDPYSLLAMAVPMVIFYEASILIGRLMKR